MTRAWIMTLVLWGCALALATLALHELPIAELLRSSFQLSLPQMLVWAGLNLAVMLLSAERWRQLLRALSCRVPLMRLLSNRLAGQTVSFLTPGPQFGGEPLQVYWLVRRDRVAVHRALLSLGLDRIIELWVNFSILLLGLLLVFGKVGAAFPQRLHAVIAIALLLILMSILLYLLVRRPQSWLPPLRRWCERWQHHPRLAGMAAHWDALDGDMNRMIQEHGTLLPRCLLISLVSWSAILLELWWLMRCAGIDSDLAGFALLAVSIRLAMLLPLPGGIGTLEAAVLWAVPLIGSADAQALTLILLMRSRDVVLLLCGLVALATQRTTQRTD